MSTVRYALKIADDDLTNNIELTEVNYNRRFCLERVVKSTDGEVLVDLTSAGAISVLYINTSAPVTIKLTDNSTFVLESILFMTKGVSIASVQNLNSKTDAVVKIYAYGSV